MLDVFISSGVIFLVSRKLVPLSRQGYLAGCYCEIHSSDKINFPI